MKPPALPCHPDIYSESKVKRRVASGSCYSCPIRLKCLREGMESGTRHGVWGGFDLTARASRVRGRALLERLDSQGQKPIPSSSSSS